MAAEERFEQATEPPVRGILTRPEEIRFAAVLAHGAGSNSRAPVLVAAASALADCGGMVLRCDLPYRQSRASGPPRPADAARDRAGLRRAVESLRSLFPGPLLAGGHSYGGRQCSMLAAEEPEIADALLLLSYPLHPPRHTAQLRTAHLSAIRVPCLFVHGTRDPFGSIAEMRDALGLIARADLLPVEGAGHDLRKAGWTEIAQRAARMLPSG